MAQGRRDVAGEEVEIEVLVVCGIEGVQAELLPPSANALVQRSHRDGAAGGLDVELDVPI